MTGALAVRVLADGDGVLDVECSVPPGRGIDPTARLCDAIEVIPQP